MKILFVIDNLGSGGAQRQVVNVAVLMKKAGHNVALMKYGDYDFFRPKLTQNSIDVFDVYSKTIPGRIINVTGFIRRYKADVVISFLETPNFLVCLSKLLFARSTVITTELSAKKETFVGIKRKLMNTLEYFAKYKVCNSENAASAWKAHYPKLNNKFKVIYNPVLLPEVQNEYKLRKDDKTHIVVAASYQKLKNPCRVIEAVNLLEKPLREKLVIDWYGRMEVTTGDTKEYDRAVALLKQYGLEETIRLHPETNDIYSKMQEADVIGLFSEVEGLPNAICEGMMLGKPIIMSRVSDYNVLVSDNGFLCDPFDKKSISASMENIIRLTDDDMKKMGNVSKEIAEKLFDPMNITKQWNDLING